MKPFYSIQELSDILDEDIYTIADALSASGVKLQQDVSRWRRPITDYGNGSIAIITGLAIVPDPRIVIVSVDFLPESWRKYIEIAGDSTVQQENDPSLSAANGGGSSTDLPPALSSSSCESQPAKEIVRTERARSKSSVESDAERTEMETTISFAKPVDKKSMLTNDWPLKQSRTISLDEALSNVPKWLSSALVCRGAPGKGSALWNPAMFAVCLLDREMSTKGALTRHIRTYFPEWVGEWEEQLSRFNTGTE